MNEIAIFAIEKIADIGIAAFNEKISEKITDQRVLSQARTSLKSYLERQNKLNYFCTFEEEIDFGGIVQYIQSDLAEDMKLRLFGDVIERT